MDGKGILVWDNGRRYTGDFKEDKRTGYGEFIWDWQFDKECQSECEERIKGGLLPITDKKKTCYCKQGRKFVGTFKNGK